MVSAAAEISYQKIYDHLLFIGKIMRDSAFSVLN